jgi:hypothetical protein
VWSSDLAAMTLDRVRAPDEHQVQIVVAVDDRNQYRGRARHAVMSQSISRIVLMEPAPQLLDLLASGDDERFISRHCCGAIVRFGHAGSVSPIAYHDPLRSYHAKNALPDRQIS